MSAADIISKIIDAAEVAESAVDVVKGILGSIRRRDWKTVDKILSGPLKVELARAAAYAKAAEKFGGE
jgi:hypothetical protein